ncbi:MAG: class I SAM-dependent methyltransferase [Anaerolineales bacterium]
MDVRAYNREAWNRQVAGGENPWTKPVSAEVIAHARQNKFAILLTEQKPVPMNWFPPLRGADVLCLASGGGQQAPILAAAGANVTVLDNSPRQLEQDRLVAKREALTLLAVEGDAADLSAFADESFDLVFNPCSTVFMKDVRPVWKEAYRVLRRGGIFMTGSMNPILYMLDLQKFDAGVLEIKYAIPYSDLKDLDPETLQREVLDKGYPVEFGHSLTDLLGGQCEAGFHIVAMYEDVKADSPLEHLHPAYIATRAIKP